MIYSDQRLGGSRIGKKIIWHNLIEIYRSNGFKGKYLKLLTKLRNSKKNLLPGEKPPMIKTHLRNCIVTPEMIGSIVGVYTGKGKTIRK